MFERGEANIDYQTSPAYLRSVVPLVEQGLAVPMMTWGALDDDGNIVRDPTFPDIPSFKEVCEATAGCETSGDAWEAWKAARPCGTFRSRTGSYLPSSDARIRRASAPERSNEVGSMGFGVAGVLGAKLAAPERPCVSVCGDGAFLMHAIVRATSAPRSRRASARADPTSSTPRSPPTRAPAAPVSGSFQVSATASRSSAAATNPHDGIVAMALGGPMPRPCSGYRNGAW
jgi:hypothetical protein